MKGLEQLGINSEYAPINDILTNGRKISGNAQTRKLQTVLQHGTVLMDVDVDTMFSLLKVPNEKIKDKLIADVKQRVTSIHHCLGKDIPFNKVANAMKQGFEEEFQIHLVEGRLTVGEQAFAEQFEKETFLTEKWNRKR